MKKFPLLFFFLGIIVLSCNKNNDAPIIEEEQETPVEEAKLPADYPAQDFMWQAMNSYYFWQADVADLGDDRFDTSEKYVDFLASESDPGEFFYKICNNHISVVGEAQAVDRFSVAFENYKDLVNVLSGVSMSNGVEFTLYAFQDSNDIFGVVNYIMPNSDASNKQIKRGDAFVGVNGTTLNRDNYIDLLYGENATYTLNMADIIDNTVTENNVEVSLTKVENFSENPILVSKVIEQNGVKIGYLMYNSFLADYDEQLNDVFGNFKSEGITELVLDFRYNGGGRVSTAVQIASSVYGTKTDELFLKARYNAKVQAIFTNREDETNFSDTTFGGVAINELNLKRVHVITTTSTASASELVINGLTPYIDVVTIGDKTRGKNEFSITLVDDASNGFFYDPNTEENINPDNQWGIQPLLGRNENADGFSDYTTGLLPTLPLEEDISNLGVLGNPSEPLLALALNHISGETAKYSRQPSMTAELFSSSFEFKGTNNVSSMTGLIKMKPKD
ncbi:S41 family peptidase [Maribacter sp. X9]|uniref:S41 family peptidase n=1 Tax=Maribacter sp. X9 TaxID=3402159 RepID=UPI003AF3A18F